MRTHGQTRTRELWANPLHHQTTRSGTRVGRSFSPLLPDLTCGSTSGESTIAVYSRSPVHLVGKVRGTCYFGAPGMTNSRVCVRVSPPTELTAPTAYGLDVAFLYRMAAACAGFPRCSSSGDIKSPYHCWSMECEAHARPTWRLGGFLEP